MLNATDIRKVREILAKCESSADINKVIDEIKQAQVTLQRDAKKSFSVGDEVQFTGRNGKTECGQIIKINPKTIVVKTSFLTWKVAPTLLKKA